MPEPDEAPLSEVVAEVIAAWDMVVREAKVRFPHATDEDLAKIASGAMHYALHG